MPTPSPISPSRLLKSLGWHWLLSVLSGVGLLLILPWWLQGCGLLRAPLQCRPTAQPIDQPGLSVTDYRYGIKCQESLK